MLTEFIKLADAIENEIQRTGRNPEFGEVKITIPYRLHMKLFNDMTDLLGRFPSSGNPRMGYPNVFVINEFLIVESTDGKNPTER